MVKIKNRYKGRIPGSEGPALILGIFLVGYLALCGIKKLYQEEYKHRHKLKNDPNYAQTYHDKTYPLKVIETKKGIRLKLEDMTGYPIFATDNDMDGKIDSAHKWVGGGRTWFGKIKYDPNDWEYKEIQKRYTRKLESKKE